MPQPPQAFVSDLVRAVSRLAPPELAESWDNVGLQVGHPAAPLRRVLVALELTAPVLAEARQMRADALVTHHPVIFKPLTALNLAQPASALIADALRADLAIIAAHTNLDAAQWSTAHALAERLGWTITDPLLPRDGSGANEPYYKFLVFVPQGHEAAVIEAIARGGGGQIGAYTHCTFRAPGIGTFKGGAGSKPYIGQAGQLESAEEFQLEAIVPAHARERVYREVRAAHPYETMACDWVQLASLDQPVGLGGMVRLDAALRPAELASLLLREFNPTQVRLSGPADKKIKTVAICTGSGGSYIGKAAARADALITGEITYHHAVEAHQRGLAVMEMGHFESEVIVCAPLAQRLAADEKLKAAGVEVLPAKDDFQPFRLA